MCNRYLICIAIAAAAVTSACDIHYTEERPVYEHPREVYVAPAPAPAPVYQPAPVAVYEAPPQEVVVVREAPPPVQYEEPPRAPAPGYVWVSGYWVRHGNRWEWSHGHYERPPHAGAVWVPNRWEHHHGDEYHFSLGFWK